MATSAIFKRDFWPNNPTLWFLHCEIMLSEHDVSDDDKFKLIVEKLPIGVKEKIPVLIRYPPETNKYETLKSRVIEIYKDDDKIIQMLTARAPSRVLDFIRLIGGLDGVEEINVDALSEIWMRFLPEPVRDVLVLAETIPLAIKATMADKIVAAMNKNIATESCNLQQEVQYLADEVLELQRMIQNRPKCHEEECLKEASSVTQANAEQNTEPICYYHERFGKEAFKCSEPCKFGETTIKNKQENLDYFNKIRGFDMFYKLIYYLQNKK